MQPVHHFLPHERGRLHVLEWPCRGPDSGPTIVCQHYMWTSAEIWADLFGALGGRYRLLSIDAPGHGESDALDPEDRAQTLLSVMDPLVGDRAILVGASNGAFRSTAFALRHPGRVSRLVLVEPPVLAHGNSRDAERQRMSALPAAPQTFEDLFAAYRRHIYPRADPALLKLFLERTWNLRDGAWRARLSIDEIPGEINGFEMTTAAPYTGLRMPVLVVYGQNSRLCGPAGAELLRNAIPQAAIVGLRECGHIVHLNHPERLYQAIGDFCRQELAAASPVP